MIIACFLAYVVLMITVIGLASTIDESKEGEKKGNFKMVTAVVCVVIAAVISGFLISFVIQYDLDNKKQYDQVVKELEQTIEDKEIVNIDSLGTKTGRFAHYGFIVTYLDDDGNEHQLDFTGQTKYSSPKVSASEDGKYHVDVTEDGRIKLYVPAGRKYLSK